ncbi:hypothetical protein TorRG33x02_184390, partial [Trema orientale]
ELGHDTSDYLLLKDQIEGLIQQGYLRDYVIELPSRTSRPLPKLLVERQIGPSNDNNGAPYGQYQTRSDKSSSRDHNHKQLSVPRLNQYGKLDRHPVHLSLPKDKHWWGRIEALQNSIIWVCGRIYPPMSDRTARDIWRRAENGKANGLARLTYGLMNLSSRS